MSKFEILKYSGCLRRLLLTIFVICASAFGIFALRFINPEFLKMVIGIISSASFFTSAVIVFKDFSLLFKILFGKYTIEHKRLKGFESRRPFDTIDSHQKILVFSNKRITVEEAFAKNMKIGDLITLVFANKIQYPIIIVKREVCDDAN